MHFEQRREREGAASEGGGNAAKTVDVHGGKKVQYSIKKVHYSI